MNEDTRKLILRIQSEDLAALWSASTENNSEIDATLRTYRRQLSLLDRHLDGARQTGTSENTTEATINETAAPPRRITDGTASILTELGDVHQPGVAYAHCGTPSLFTSSASTPPVVDATTACQFPQVSERPVVHFPRTPMHVVVRLPPIASNVEEGERTDKLMRDKDETGIRCRQEQEAREEIERKDRIRKEVEALITPFEKAVCSPSLVSNKPATPAGTNLKRSADHLSAPDGPPSKKQASVIVKEEPKLEPGLSAPKDTIRDKVENLLQSSRALSGPTPSARSAKRRGPGRDWPPTPSGHKTQRPAARPDPYQTYTSSGPTVPGVPVIPSLFLMPNTPPAMMGSNVGHGRLFHQPVGFFQELPRAATTASAALEIMFNAAPLETQREMLGGALYPKIHEQQPEHAGKITGMLLEMDNAELFHLISDSAALRYKVDEALRVYRDYLKTNNVESV